GEDARGDVGCGVHQGWLLNGTVAPNRRRVQSFALACDFIVPVTTRVHVRGEAFDGQALRGLGGGGIGQNFDGANDPLRTVGGWAQLNLRPTSLVATGFGCGTDQPHAGAARSRNDACAAYATVQPAGPVFAAVELRRIR